MEKYSDLEIDLLRQFWQNADLRDVIYKTLNQKFSVPRDLKLTNEEIGERNRAIWAAQDIVNSAFKEIESYNQPADVPKVLPNQAR